MMSNYSKYNAENVLNEVEKFIKRGLRCRIEDCYEELSIFDWWNTYLSVSQAKQMRSFLKEAIKLGYTGYVCFRVGASGCSHGMWAAKEETTDGYNYIAMDDDVYMYTGITSVVSDESNLGFILTNLPFFD